MAGFEPEELLCELDSLLFSLVGAFDVAARITDLLLGMNSGRSVGWQYVRPGGWQAKLEPIAADLYEYTRDATPMQWAFQVLRWLRNSVHNEALNLTRDDRKFHVALETETQERLRGFLREANAGWGRQIWGSGFSRSAAPRRRNGCPAQANTASRCGGPEHRNRPIRLRER
jgi:hypothetical protein